MSNLNAIYTQGVSFIQQNQFQNAIPLLLQVTQSLPDYVPSRMNLANCYSEIGNFLEALKHFKHLVNQIKSNDKYKQYEFQIYGNIAQLYMDLKKTDKSIKFFEKALQINNDWYEGHYNLANLYHEKGEPENEAKTLYHYEKAIELEPNEAESHSNYSLCLFQSGKLPEAKKRAEIALKLSPNSSMFNYNLANICQYAGDLEEAMRYIKRAIELDPFHYDSIFCLANLYELSNEPNFAIQYYEQSIEIINSVLQDEKSSDNSLFWTFADYSFRYYSLLQKKNLIAESKQVIRQILEGGSTILNNIEKSLLYFLAGDYKQGSELLISNQLDIDTTNISKLCLKSIASIHLRNTSEIIHKCKLAKNIQNAKFDHIIPKTFIIHSYSELIEAITNYEKDHRVNVWYLKDPHKQRAQGITIFSNSDDDLQMIKEKDLLRVEKEYCLQTSVEKVSLLDGLKFGLRIHTFVISYQSKLHIYLFKDAILTKCGTLYSPNDKSELNQITCTSVQRSLPGYDRTLVKGPASVLYPNYPSIFEKIAESVTLSITAVKNKIDSVESKVEDLSISENQVRFQMFGYDYIVNDEDYPILLEVNSSPQLGDAQNMPQLTYSIGTPLINSIPYLLSNCIFETPISSHFWVKLPEVVNIIY